MYDSKRKKNRTTTKIKRKITIHSSVKIRYYKYVIINLQFITLIIKKGAKEEKKEYSLENFLHFTPISLRERVNNTEYRGDPRILAVSRG